ncbi:hypothetical protein CRG98_012227 [Punica granatum]|uniref:Tf2-1-like SH3-like domain-containing protein n=1 Tax=Punica granatum TaxID=22663 RepID=A0A2I0KGS2_PUNGR|nr:hypothetical protein CRG98_012227 [Punica granatum]
MTIRGRILSTQGRMMRQKTWQVGDSSDDDDSRTNSLHLEENDAAEYLDRFSAGDYHKLTAGKIGPVEIVEKIYSNAYRLKLPSHIRTADVFNVKHRIPHTGDSSDNDDSRTNSLHPGENDAAEVPASRRRHVEFEIGDFVWAVLTKDLFSAGDYHKLAARKIGPEEIVEKINSNAYRIKLPSHIHTADVLNVKHLIPFTGDSSDDDDSRTNSLHPGENDAAEYLTIGIKGVADRRRRHVEFEVGDFVWAVLTKDRFSAGDYHKLAARKIGPVEIVEKIISNAYRLKLPSHIRTADVFNVKHLIPHTGDSSDDDDSRTNSLHPGENDAAEDLSFRALSNLGFEFDAYFSVFVESTGDSSDDDDSRTKCLHPGENDAAEDLTSRRRHVEFVVGDFVWAVVTKDRFSAGDYHKLAARKIGPEEVVEKINSNAYRLKLPSHIDTADVFNVKHVIPYTGDSSDDDDSRTNCLHPGENDAAEDLTSRYFEKNRL